MSEEPFLEGSLGATRTGSHLQVGNGDRLGPYTIAAFIGAGGMGEVYRAHDPRLKRDVAIKVLSPFGADPGRDLRLLGEAQAASALNHPNILTVYDVGSQPVSLGAGPPITYIVMELLTGQTLRERLNAHEHGDVSPVAVMTVAEAIDIAEQVLSGLVSAHGKGIVHRDLKPENLFVTTEGRVKILDFGLAKQISSDRPSLTSPGTVLGTVGYMAPEQVRGEPADHRADLFSFGAILFEMLAGRRAFSAPTAAEAMTAVLRDEPASLTSLRGDVPPALEQVVRRCLRKRAGERFPSARDLSEELARVKAGFPRASAASIVTGAKRWVPRAWLAGAALVLVLAMAGYIAYSTAGNAPISSVAILPFTNVGATPDTEWLSDGLTESLIRDLSQVTRLDVKARPAVFRYKGRELDPQLVGRELKVQAVLTGRLVRRGETLSISLELVEVRDNRHLWGDQYEYKLGDLLQAQAHLSRTVAAKLKLQLSGAEQQQLARRSTQSTAAQEFYLKGRFHWSQQTSDGLRQAIAYFQQALKEDPMYALPYIGLADSYIVLGEDLEAPAVAMPQAKAYALEALRLDETLGEAHAALGIVKLLYEWDWPGAERELAPNLNAGQTVEAFSCALHYSDPLGRNEEGIVEIKRALDRDPLSLIAGQEFACASYYGRHYDQAIKQLQGMVAAYPDHPWAHFGLGRALAQKGLYPQAIAALSRAMVLTPEWPPAIADLGYTYAVSGRKAEARTLMQHLREQSTRRYVDPYLMATISVGLGESDQAFTWLERAYRDRSSFLPWLKVEPKWDPLHSDPRFADLLRRVGLAASRL